MSTKSTSYQALHVLARRISVLVFAVLGVFAIAFGEAWAPFVLGVLSETPGGAWIELVVPLLPVVLLLVSATIWSGPSR